MTGIIVLNKLGRSFGSGELKISKNYTAQEYTNISGLYHIFFFFLVVGGGGVGQITTSFTCGTYLLG